MLPNRREQEQLLRYRRTRDSGGLNPLRIAIILTVSIGIVVATLVLTNTYEFNPIPEATIDKDSVQKPVTRPVGGSGIGSSDLLSPSRSDSSSAQLGTGSSGAKSGGSSMGTGGASGIDGIAGNTSGGDSSSDRSTASSSSQTGANGSTGIDDQLVSSGAGSETVVAGCSIHGRVTDDWGSSMVGVRVFATTADGTVIESITDSRGRYTLPVPTPDAASMSVSLVHVTDSAETFAVMVGDNVISLSTPIDPESSGCEVNFDSWNVQEQMVASPIAAELWPDAASIYQYTLNAESLALSLGTDLESSTTLQVQAWCDDSNFGCDSSPDGAYFIAAGELEEDSPPIIAMLPSRSSDQSPGIPDNREYHEYGHYFLSLKTGDSFELPTGDTNHGGYYNNSTTRDSFVEGFSEFYSMMVSRHVDNDQNAEIYTIGADYDLESDRLPWEAEGWWEEFTVAGLLLDLVDDDSDYEAGAAGLSGVNILAVTTDSEPSGTIITGNVVNSSPLVVRDADVTVRYLNDAGDVIGTQITRVLPEVIAPTREGTFYAAPPAGLEVAQATATVGGIAKSDDDDMTIDLLRLMSLITEFEREDGKLGVSNVAELYDALINDDSQYGGGTNLGEISSTQVDTIFVNHGFFADLDGDRTYNPNVDGAIGASSHPVTVLGGNSFSEFIPRQDPDPYDGSFVKINTGDVDVDAIIQISIPEDGGSGSYAYVAPRGSSDQVELAVPPAGKNAEVTIITAGKGFRPVIAFRVDADNFHEKVENGTISELQVAPVELEAGATIRQPNTNSTAIQFGVMIGGIVAVFLVVASLIAIRRQWGKA